MENITAYTDPPPKPFFQREIFLEWMLQNNLEREKHQKNNIVGSFWCPYIHSQNYQKLRKFIKQAHKSGKQLKVHSKQAITESRKLTLKT